MYRWLRNKLIKCVKYCPYFQFQFFLVDQKFQITFFLLRKSFFANLNFIFLIYIKDSKVKDSYLNKNYVLLELHRHIFLSLKNLLNKENIILATWNIYNIINMWVDSEHLFVHNDSLVRSRALKWELYTLYIRFKVFSVNYQFWTENIRT